LALAPLVAAGVGAGEGMRRHESRAELRIRLHNSQVENKKLRHKVRVLEGRGRRAMELPHSALKMGRVWLIWWKRP
jgi:hypothetical protein